MEGFAWLDSKGLVTVDRVLLEELQEEVLEMVAAAQKRKPAPQSKCRCPACPFRAFDRATRVAARLRKYHTTKTQFCCSGTKQLRVILALHDSDMIKGVRCGGYLKRSAVILRQQVKPSLSATNNKVDRFIRLLLDAKGPRFVHHKIVEAKATARRCGNLWYTHAFGEKLFQEILLQHGKARQSCKTGI